VLRTNPPNRDECNPELYSLAQGYRKGMSSSVLWLPALRSINPLPVLSCSLLAMLLTIYGIEWPILCWCAYKKLVTRSSEMSFLSSSLRSVSIFFNHFFLNILPYEDLCIFVNHIIARLGHRLAQPFMFRFPCCVKHNGITYPLVLVPFVSLLREFGTP